MQADGFIYMDDFSTWDVYRAAIPLQYLLNPTVAKDMVMSLIAKTEQGGWLPIFPGRGKDENEDVQFCCSVCWCVWSIYPYFYRLMCVSMCLYIYQLAYVTLSVFIYMCESHSYPPPFPHSLE